MTRCFFRYTWYLGLGVFCFASQIQATPLKSQQPLDTPNYYLVNGKVVTEEEAAILRAEEHYCAGVEAFNAELWYIAARQFKALLLEYPRTSYAQEVGFYLGICFYNVGEYDFANEAFTNYLKCQSNPKYFLETIEYKFAIAEQFRCGARCRCFGKKHMPKWVPGEDLGLQIYDEVAIAMPHHDLAAQSLYSKAYMLWKQCQYRESVEAFQMVIRRFPKHEFAPESYLAITRIYLDQCKNELQNPDNLDFAEINVRKFEADFPNDDRVALAKADVLAIKELSARGLFNTGDFYQRTWRPQAAVIYYQKAMVEFPETLTANWCKRRLRTLCPEALDISIPTKAAGKEEDFSVSDDGFDAIDFK